MIMTATRPARQDADSITVRDTGFGPEIVYDYGIQATVIGLTENDMDRTLAVLAARPGRMLTCEQAAEQERHELLAAELVIHLSNIKSEMRRYDAAIAHIDSVYRLRLGLESPQENRSRDRQEK